MANHLLGEDPDRHPPLPLVAVPGDDTSAAWPPTLLWYAGCGS
ncbi:hypothetical protein ACTMS9_05825 [Micromonospora sp. L31]